MRTLAIPRMLHAGIWPGTGAILLSALSGLLYALAFPPWSLAPLAWVALVPFLVAVGRLAATRQAVLCAVTWTVVAAYGVGWWFPAMVAAYFEVPRWIGWVTFFVVSGALVSPFFAAFAVWVSWLGRRRAAHPLVIAAGWGACELARARLLYGNPWALSGYSQAGVLPLVQLADLLGVYGVGMLIAAVNACVASALVPRLRPPRPALACAMVALLWVGVFAYGTWRLGAHFGSGDPIDVAIVQGDVDHDFRARPGGRQAALERYLALTESIAGTAPDLVVWPEYALDFFLQEPSRESDAVLAVTHEMGADFLVGGPAYAFGAERFQYTNSVFLLRAGAIEGRYDKLRPLPVAEEGLFPRLVRRPLSYQRGREPRPLTTRVGTVGSFVCSDGVHPELVRSLTADGTVELLVDLSNDSWFANGAPARHHLDMVAFRAVESRRWVARATTTGYSAVIDPHGKIVAASAFRQPQVLLERVERSHATTFYQRWGETPIVLAIAAAVAWSLAHAWRLRELTRGSEIPLTETLATLVSGTSEAGGTT